MMIVGQNAGQVDVADLLQARGTVDARRLVQLRVDAGQRGHVDDGAEPGALPDLREHVDPRERDRNAHEVDRIQAQEASQVAGESDPRVEEQDDHRRHHHGGDEVREVGDHLHRALERAVADLVERQRQDDRRHEAERHHQHVDRHHVADQRVEVGGPEEQQEVLQSHPFAAPDALHRRVVAEGDLGSHHRDVLEDENVGQGGGHHQVVLPVAADLHPRRTPSGPGVRRSGLHAHGARRFDVAHQTSVCFAIDDEMARALRNIY